MKRVLFAVMIALLPAAIQADEMNVSADPKARFEDFKTFAIRDRKIASDRPEIDNRLFIKKLESTIRAGLREKGVTEAGSGRDLVVDFSLVGQDISTARQTPMRGVGPQPLRFTAATLTIDMSRPGETDPVWRGVYRDDEMTGSKLVEKLPQDAGKLIDKYPKRKTP